MSAEESASHKPRYSVLNCTRVAFLHLTLIFAIISGFSWPTLLVFVVTYLARCFAIGGVYHRYFSHQSYETSRWFQFVLATLGCTTGQRGPLSWATSHRLHHQHADDSGDPHSPNLGGFWHAQMGWYLEKDALPTENLELRRFEDAPEILWLNQHHSLVFLLYLSGLYILGAWTAKVLPESGATPWQFVLWGGFVSTLLLIHATGLINSATHLCGKRDYDTPDESRNVSWLFWLTFGENWHNTHHRFPWSANTGLKRGHRDWIFTTLRCLEKCRLIHGLKDAAKNNRKSA